MHSGAWPVSPVGILLTGMVSWDPSDMKYPRLHVNEASPLKRRLVSTIIPFTGGERRSQWSSNGWQTASDPFHTPIVVVPGPHVVVPGPHVVVPGPHARSARSVVRRLASKHAVDHDDITVLRNVSIGQRRERE
eukprot:581220_1